MTKQGDGQSADGKYMNNTNVTSFPTKESSQKAGSEPKDGTGEQIGDIDRRGVANQGVKNSDTGDNNSWARKPGGFGKQGGGKIWSSQPPDDGGRAPGDKANQGTSQAASQPPADVKVKSSSN